LGVKKACNIITIIFKHYECFPGTNYFNMNALIDIITRSYILIYYIELEYNNPLLSNVRALFYLCKLIVLLYKANVLWRRKELKFVIPGKTFILFLRIVLLQRDFTRLESERSIQADGYLPKKFLKNAMKQISCYFVVKPAEKNE